MKLILLLILLFTILNITLIKGSSEYEFSFSSLPSYQGTNFKNLKGNSGFLNNKFGKNSEGQLYYLLIRQHDENGNLISNTNPLLIFLNGGPGCSSLISTFLEIGPIRFNLNGSLTDNLNSYSRNFNILFIDNPTGAGYSPYIESDNNNLNALQVGNQLLNSLLDFYSKFSEFKNRPLYLYGESYGGKYVISFAKYIDEYNLNNLNNQIKLEGIVMGNAWISPDIQESTYGEQTYIVGLIDYSSFLRVNSLQSSCHGFIEQKMYAKGDSSSCSSALNELLQSSGGVNIYDYRLMGTYSILSKLEIYLNSKNVKNVLIGNLVDVDLYSYSQCSTKLWNDFKNDFQVDYVNYLIPLLSKYRILIINGQFDIRCSIYGTNEYLRLMNWYGKQDFNYEPHYPFYSSPISNNVVDTSKNGNTILGIFKKYENLRQVILYSSGHLSPHDVPFASSEMITRFLYKKSFCNSTNMESQTSTIECNNFKIDYQTNTMKCPNQCSNHGKCLNSDKCQCEIGYYGNDCSIIRNDITFGKQAIYSNNLVFGNNYHLYNLYIPFDNSIGLFDIRLILSKTSKLGKLHLYLQPNNETFLNITNNFNNNFKNIFNYYDLEDVNEKTLQISNLNRNSTHSLTIIVLNTVDTESNYNLIVETVVSGKKLDSLLVLSIILFSFLVIVSIALFGMYIVQYYNDRKLLQNIKYELIPNQ